MKRAAIAAGAIGAAVLVLVTVTAGQRARNAGLLPAEREGDTPAAASPEPPSSAAAPAAEAEQGFLYGRVTTYGGVYEGRLRWGDGSEAFWGDYFNGAKDHNPWSARVPPERLPKEREAVAFFGLEIAQRERPVDLGRLFMARFGDIARVEARGRQVRVTLKSGTVIDLDRFEASDFDDGVRVWDGARGLVDLDSSRIRAIEFLPTARLDATPGRLHGTVRTRQGVFTGFVQWDRQQCVGTDELHGRAADGAKRLRFDTIRSIARHSGDGSQVTLLDGREIVLSDNRAVGQGNRGIYVDDRRYGRVLVSWEAFERVDLGPGGAGPAYGDFPPGRPLTGSVTTRAGRRLAGRLVYDLDESETTETLDAPSQGVDYTIPFGLVAAIVPPGRDGRGASYAEVTLHGGEALQLERAGDLGDGNAGLLIFIEGQERPEYVPWPEVERVDLDRPPAMYPPLETRSR
jgi:hypothetical protein